MTRLAPPPPVILRDTREPHEDAGDRPEAVFRPRIIGPGQPRDCQPHELGQIDLICERAKLDVGDYAPKGLERGIALERKSGLDLLATLYGETTDSVGEARKSQDRFRAELERARDYLVFAVVCEESMGWIFAEAKRRFRAYGKSFSPTNTLSLLDSFAVDLGVPVLWCGTKGLAELRVGTILARCWDQAHGGEAMRKARKRGYSMPWLGALATVADPREGADDPPPEATPAFVAT